MQKIIPNNIIPIDNHSCMSPLHSKQLHLHLKMPVNKILILFYFLKHLRFIKAPFTVLQQVLHHLLQLNRHTLDNGNHTSLQSLLVEPLVSFSGKSVLSVTSSFLFSTNTFICPYSKYTWDCSLSTTKTTLTVLELPLLWIKSQLLSPDLGL